MSDPDRTVMVSTAIAAQLHGVNARTIRKRIDAGTLKAVKYGNAYTIPVTVAALEEAGLNPEEVAVGEDVATLDDAAVAVRNSPQVPAIPEPVDLEPLAATIRHLTEQLLEKTDAAARAEARVEAAARELEQAQAREQEAWDRERAAIAQAAAASRELESMRNALVVRDDRSWLKKLLGID